MEIQQLVGFLAVSRCLSFSKAAGQTFRTQPAVSLQVQALEAELGVKLFDRLGPKSIALTEEGRIFRELVSPLVQEFESLGARFSERRDGTAGLVKIATHGSVMTYLLPKVVESFRKAAKGVELSIVHRPKEDILSLVKSGEVDLGISSVGKVPAGLTYEVLGRFKRVLVCSKRDKIAKGELSLKRIGEYALILPPSGSNTREVVERAFEQAGIEWRLALEVASREATKTYVGMGMGISIVTEYYLSQADRKRLVVRDASKFFGESERGLVLRKGRKLGKGAEKFCECLRAGRLISR